MHPAIHDHSRVHVAHLVLRKEEEEYIIGRDDLSWYIMVPREGYEIVRLLKQGRTIQETQVELARDFGEVDVKEYVHMLVRHGFIDEIDGRHVDLHKSLKIKRLIRFLAPEKVRWLFSWPMYILYAVIVIVGLAFLVKTPGYFPSFQDYFFVGVYSVLVPVSFIVGWILVFLHELAHYIAARSLGITAKFGISNRLFYVVAITDVTNLYAVDRKKRFRVMAAGLGIDLLVICLGFILLGLIDQGVLGASVLVYKFIKLVLLLEFFGIVWQSMFYLRTDVYYIFEHLMGVYNLHQKTMLFIKNKLFHKRFRIHYSSVREQHLVRIYAWLVGLGVLVLAFMTVYYSVPILVTVLTNTIKNVFSTAVHADLSRFLDSVVFLWFFAINQSLLIYSLIKKYDLLRRPVFYVISLLLFLATNYFIIFFITLFFLRAVAEPLVTYAVLMVTGIIFTMFLLKVIRRLNAISRIKVMPEAFLFAITLVYAYILGEFSGNFVEAVNLVGVMGASIGISYGLGMALGYLWHFEKSIRGV